MSNFSFSQSVFKRLVSQEHQKVSCGNGLIWMNPKFCSNDGWLVVLGFNATLTAKVILWRSVTHMCFLAFSH